MPLYIPVVLSTALANVSLPSVVKEYVEVERAEFRWISLLASS